MLVTLKGDAANVRLMDSSNFSSYRAGRRHRFYGGHATRSPARLQVPHTSHWHVAVDFGGLGGQVRSGVQVLPGPLKPIRERPLSSIPTLVNRDAAITPGVDGGEPYDVFVSYASDDKDAVVRPLAHALQSAGLRVWFDGFALHIGDSLRQKIDRGLATSRFGVVGPSETNMRPGAATNRLTEAVLGKRRITPDTALRLSRFLKTSPQSPSSGCGCKPIGISIERRSAPPRNRDRLLS